MKKITFITLFIVVQSLNVCTSFAKLGDKNRPMTIINETDKDIGEVRFHTTGKGGVIVGISCNDIWNPDPIKAAEPDPNDSTKKIYQQYKEYVDNRCCYDYFTYQGVKYHIINECAGSQEVKIANDGVYSNGSLAAHEGDVGAIFKQTFGIDKAEALLGSYGDKLIYGASKLDASPEILQAKGVDGLQKQLIGGLQSELLPLLIKKVSAIAQNRAEIAKFNTLISNNKNIATELGKGQLVDDLLDGFAAADAALSALWGGPNLLAERLQSSSKSSTAFGALRSHLETEATASQDYTQEITANKNKGILADLLFTGQDAINATQNVVNTLRNQINVLRKKIDVKLPCYNSLNLCTLPDRMRAFGRYLKSLL